METRKRFQKTAKPGGSLIGSALLLAGLTACEAETIIVDTGAEQTGVVAEIYSEPVDPAKVVCDPFQNNPAYPGFGRYHGVVGKLGYIPEGLPAAQVAADFDDRGVWIDADLFLSDINVPTRSFDLGFFNQEGDLLVDQTGDKLYENFALWMETRVQLSADDVEGDYQFAILSDDGAVVEIDRGQGWETLIDNDGLSATRLRGSLERIPLTRTTSVPIRVKYFQGPRYHIAAVLLWRPYPAAGGFPAQDVRFGQSGNSLWFNYSTIPSVPKDPYMELLNRGWRPVSPRNFALPTSVAANPCVPAVPAPRVDAACRAGSFIPKTSPVVGLSIDIADTSASSIVTGLTGIGYTPIIYSDNEVTAGKPVADGVNVLLVSRTAVSGPVTQAYRDAIRAFVFQGGSLIGEYDGAALAFTDKISGGQPIIANLTPPFAFFEGMIAGGGALLPVESSRTYVIDAVHPITTGLPANFLNGVRTAFAVTNYDETWLKPQAQFTSTGYANLVPAGTFPAILSGRCGGGRVALFTMNYFQVLSQNPISTLVRQAIRWSVGQ